MLSVRKRTDACREIVSDRFMIKILADENFPKIAVDTLRSRGHDVAWVHTDAPGISDIVVMKRAIAEVAVAALESRLDWSGHFSVVDEDRIRMIPMP